MTISRTLDNGVRVVCSPDRSLRSAALGIWLAAGSRHERPRESGAAHFLEHMYFKGAAGRGPYEVAFEINRLGSHVNAFTSQEFVCLHGHVIHDRLGDLIDLLGELFMGPTLDPEEVERERQVILDEVMMYDDTPDERVNDLFTETLWAGAALGRSILGSAESLSKLDAPALRRFERRWRTSERIIVTMAGAVDVDAAVERLNRRLGEAPSAGADDAREARRPKTRCQRAFQARDLEQTHFCFGLEGPCRRAPDRYDMALLNLVFGGGMSSRLFQEVREKRGLAYAIGSYTTGFTDTGYLAISGGTTPEHMPELLDICWRETARMYREDTPEAELENARDMLRSSLVLNLEGAYAQMMRLGECMIYHGRPVPVEETLEAIAKVTPRSVRECAERYLAGRPVAAAYIGPASAREATEGRDRFPGGGKKDASEGGHG